MEELSACGSCRQPIHRSAVRCPRCSAFQRRFRSKPQATPMGYRDAARGPEPAEPVGAAVSAPLRSSADDLGAPDEQYDEPGVFRGLVLPHPGIRGIVRWVEIALTVVALPLIASSVFGLVLLLLSSFDLPWQTRREIRGPAWMFRALGIVAGTAVLLTAFEMDSIPRETTAIVLAVQLGAVGARTALRTAALAPRRRRLDLRREIARVPPGPS